MRAERGYAEHGYEPHRPGRCSGTPRICSCVCVTHRISVISTANAERPSSGESEEKLRSMKASAQAALKGRSAGRL